MMERLSKAAMFMTIIGGILLVTCEYATAGDWLFKPGLDGGPHIWEYKADDSDYSHLDNTAPATPHPRNVPYSVTLRNPTKWTIAYSLNDKRNARLKPGEWAKWIIKGSKDNPARFHITFDNGQKKEIKYHLKNNSVFEFRVKGKSVDLYKK